LVTSSHDGISFEKTILSVSESPLSDGGTQSESEVDPGVEKKLSSLSSGGLELSALSIWKE
jgi:hypothetical protein